jgi:hypothetical protein
MHLEAKSSPRCPVPIKVQRLSHPLPFRFADIAKRHPQEFPTGRCTLLDFQARVVLACQRWQNRFDLCAPAMLGMVETKPLEQILRI